MEDNTSRMLGRREVIRTLVTTTGVAALSGCSALWGQPGATDVKLHNAAKESKTVSVTITASGSKKPHTSRTVEVGAGATVDQVNRSKLPTNAKYTVEVGVDDESKETFAWDDPTVEQAPLWVFVDDTRNIKFLFQAG